MKDGIHPKYNQNAKFVCNSCKQVYLVGSTTEGTTVEVCSNCHPFYTGKQNQLVDTDDRIKNFQKRLEQKDDSAVVKKRRKSVARKSKGEKEVGAGPKLTLRDMLKSK